MADTIRSSRRRPDILRGPAVAWLALSVLLPSGTARAGNQDSYFQGNDAAMTGGAVVAIAHDASAIWYNPAGLGANERRKLDLSGSAFVLRLRTIDDGMVGDILGVATARDLRSTEILSVPSALGITRQVADGLSIGAGVFVSAQDSFTLAGNLATPLPGFRVSLTQTTEFSGQTARYHAGGAIGWQPSPRFRVGAALFGVYERLDVAARYSLDFINEETMPTTRIILFGDTGAAQLRFEIEVVLGIQAEPVDGLHLGLVIRSPRVLLFEHLKAETLVGVSAIGPDFEPVAELGFDDDPVADSPAGIISPLRGYAGIAWEHAHGFVAVEADFTHGLTRVDNGLTYVDLEPAWNVRAGARFDLSRKVSVGFGFFTDRSVSPPPVEFSELRVHWYGAATGMQLSTPVQLGEGESADQLIFSTTFGLRYAVGVGTATGLRLGVQATEEPFVSSVDRIDVVWHEVGLHVGSSVWF